MRLGLIFCMNKNFDIIEFYPQIQRLPLENELISYHIDRVSIELTIIKIDCKNTGKDIDKTVSQILGLCPECKSHTVKKTLKLIKIVIVIEEKNELLNILKRLEQDKNKYDFRNPQNPNSDNPNEKDWTKKGFYVNIIVGFFVIVGVVIAAIGLVKSM